MSFYYFIVAAIAIVCGELQVCVQYDDGMDEGEIILLVYRIKPVERQITEFPSQHTRFLRKKNVEMDGQFSFVKPNFQPTTLIEVTEISSWYFQTRQSNFYC